MIEELVRQVTVGDDDAVEELSLVADTEPGRLTPHLGALLDHDGSAKHAAEALYCHRNTVIYRTKQIEELTGRSLADPRDKLLLELGLLAAGR